MADIPYFIYFLEGFYAIGDTHDGTPTIGTLARREVDANQAGRNSAPSGARSDASCHDQLNREEAPGENSVVEPGVDPSDVVFHELAGQRFELEVADDETVLHLFMVTFRPEQVLLGIEDVGSGTRTCRVTRAYRT